MKLLLCFYLVFITFQASLAVQGFDISMYQGAVNLSTFQCFKNQGYSYMIIQAWAGGHMINPYYVQNYKNALAAGLNFVDLYAFACNNCSNNAPSVVMAAIKASLPSGFNGTIWIDVEPCTGCWLNASQNLQYVDTLISTAQSMGLKVGIYSSLNSWASVVGSYNATTPLIKSVKLWYAHYDNNPSFNDTQYYQFGGFGMPVMKQYAHQDYVCGVVHDDNWYPPTEEIEASEFSDSSEIVMTISE